MRIAAWQWGGRPQAGLVSPDARTRDPSAIEHRFAHD
jgi:hypothetical protein